MIPVEKTVFREWPKGDSIEEFPFHIQSDLVVIEQVMEEKTRGGIVLPTNSSEAKLPCGRVVAVGPGRIYTEALDAAGHNELAYFVPNPIKVGDFVTFGKYQSGEPIELEGKRYIICRANDIAGVSKTGEPVTLRLAKVE